MRTGATTGSRRKDRRGAEQLATRARAGARPEPGTGQREWTLRSGATDEYCKRPVAATPLTLVSIDPRGCASALPEPYRHACWSPIPDSARGLLGSCHLVGVRHLLAARRTASSHVCHLRALLVCHVQHLTRPVLPAESRPCPLSRALPRCCGRRPMCSEWVAGVRLWDRRHCRGLQTSTIHDHHRPKDSHTACRRSLRPALPHGTAGSAATCWPDVHCLVSPPKTSSAWVHVEAASSNSDRVPRARHRSTVQSVGAPRRRVPASHAGAGAD
jgi:hypothetical protein